MSLVINDENVLEGKKLFLRYFLLIKFFEHKIAYCKLVN